MYHTLNDKDTKSQLVYWEKQADDKLCGLHCINSVLQAPVYDEITLSQIGINLENDEVELTG
jgi:Ataxin-3